MHADGIDNAETADGFGDDAFAFLAGESLEGFVLESCDRMAVVVIAHPTFERGVAASGRILQRATIARDIQRGVAEGERFHCVTRLWSWCLGASLRTCPARTSMYGRSPGSQTSSVFEKASGLTRPPPAE